MLQLGWPDAPVLLTPIIKPLLKEQKPFFGTSGALWAAVRDAAGATKQSPGREPTPGVSQLRAFPHLFSRLLLLSRGRLACCFVCVCFRSAADSSSSRHASSASLSDTAHYTSHPGLGTLVCSQRSIGHGVWPQCGSHAIGPCFCRVSITCCCLNRLSLRSLLVIIVIVISIRLGRRSCIYGCVRSVAVVRTDSRC
jgi:hypothetical protein